MLEVSPSCRIPAAELAYRATRAGGPGGQHVNTSATRVELWWNAAQSSALSDAQRARVLSRLATRLDADGWLRLTAASRRSQAQNKAEVTERFRVLLAAALRPAKVRRATRPTAASRERRLEEKRRRGAVKRERRRRDDE